MQGRSIFVVMEVLLLSTAQVPHLHLLPCTALHGSEYHHHKSYHMTTKHLFAMHRASGCSFAEYAVWHLGRSKRQQLSLFLMNTGLAESGYHHCMQHCTVSSFEQSTGMVEGCSSLWCWAYLMLCSCDRPQYSGRSADTETIVFGCHLHKADTQSNQF